MPKAATESDGTGGARAPAEGTGDGARGAGAPAEGNETGDGARTEGTPAEGTGDGARGAGAPAEERAEAINTKRAEIARGLRTRLDASGGVKWQEVTSSHDDTLLLQRALTKLGHNPRNNNDGKWGSTTRGAVIAFQRANGLTADGKPGNATFTKLAKVMEQSSGTTETTETVPAGSADT